MGGDGRQGVVEGGGKGPGSETKCCAHRDPPPRGGARGARPGPPRRGDEAFGTSLITIQRYIS